MRALQSRSSRAATQLPWADRVVGSGVVKRVVQVSRAAAARSEDGGNRSRNGNGEFPRLQVKRVVVARSSCGETRCFLVARFAGSQRNSGGGGGGGKGRWNWWKSMNEGKPVCLRSEATGHSQMFGKKERSASPREGDCRDMGEEGELTAREAPGRAAEREKATAERPMIQCARHRSARSGRASGPVIGWSGEEAPAAASERHRFGLRNDACETTRGAPV